MGRRFNAERAVKAAAAAEHKAWGAYVATADRTREDVATAPVKGDAARGTLAWEVAHVRPASSRDSGYVWAAAEVTDPLGTLYTAEQWARLVAAAESVTIAEAPARTARRLAWERAAARLESARRALEALPPAGHKRRKDGSTYPVQGPRENAARAAGRDAFRRAIGRFLTFAAVAVAFLSLFLSACN